MRLRPLLIAVGLAGASLAVATVLWVRSMSPATLVAAALPQATAPRMADRVAHWVASVAVASWRQCPSEAFRPESAMGFLINGQPTVPTPEARERVRSLARSLVEAGCGVDEFSDFGLTPLMNAALGGDADAVGLLLSLKANPALVSRERSADLGLPPPGRQRWVGKTALEIAREASQRGPGERAGYRAVIEALERVPR